jgi:uncharacterized protein YecE (DUF72 family)
MAIRIGTSGFIYEHWRQRFYASSDRGSELERYAATFDTVELNVTFYRMPASPTFRSWAARVPPDFVFAVKASRYLTHVRRLQDPQASVELLVERAKQLGRHLGPILIQLPPDLELDLDALDATLAAFPDDLRVAVEPRHPSWFVAEVRRLLERRRVALCLADRRGPITPLWRTTDWSYLRFHAGGAEPRSCYGADELAAWADRLVAGWGSHGSGYVFFNNDGHGCALRDATLFAAALQARGVDLTRFPAVDPAVVDDPGRFIPDQEGRAPVAAGRSWSSARTGRPDLRSPGKAGRAPRTVHPRRR